MRRLLLAGSLLVPCMASAMQDSGKLIVAPQVMVGRCITMVSPESTGTTVISTVVVRVVISASGKVLPVRVISGAPALESEAMNAVRLWRYRPFLREDSPVDVVTDVKVTFEPGKPGGFVSHPNH
jgi:periplasmic protein TonB